MHEKKAYIPPQGKGALNSSQPSAFQNTYKEWNKMKAVKVLSPWQGND